MGQAKNRKAGAKNRKTVQAHLEADTLEHLRRVGQGWAPVSEAWLQQNFVKSLTAAALQGPDCWQNQLYLQALKHEDAAIRTGVRIVMGHVFTAGLVPGRTVFGLVCELKLPRREIVGEFDHCKPLEAWVAERLGVRAQDVYARHSCLFAPAHAGLFTVTTTLVPMATPKPVGEKPTARTRTVEDDAFRRQAVLFLVSVATDACFEVDGLADSSFSCELAYWGPEDVEPVSMAEVRPIEPVLAFEGVEMISFRAPLAAAAVAVGPWRELSQPQTLEVRVEAAEQGRRFLAEEVAMGRIAGTTMDFVGLYQGPDVAFFLPHLSKLGMQVVRV